MKKGIVSIFILFITTGALFAQQKNNLGDTIVNATLLQVGYAIQFPFADMGERFGNNNCISGGISFKVKNNWMFGAEANFLFGGNIKEDTMLDYLFTSGGFLIGTNGIAESVLLFERGYYFIGKFGKVIPVVKGNPNSGLQVMGGAGFIEHKIKIEDPEAAVPYVTGDYAKGYDRLTNGLALYQYIGYLRLDKRKLLNFNAGVEFIEGFTQNRRNFNFDQMKRDDSKRLDILVGLKLAWVLPLYGKGEHRMYTY
ncbi:MAG: hypothetical protein JST18_02900 [Bacteroidetes bacterium]|nr:hypothetical protein [Bacteroidota bacterium]